jgi:hypothetical protein
MHRINTEGNVNGLFVDGDPVGGQEATVVDAAWLNAMQEEPVRVILAAGLALDPNNNAQLYAALQLMINGGGGILLPDRWGKDAQAPVTNDDQHNAIVFPAGSDTWAWNQFIPWRVDVDWRVKLDQALASNAVAQAFDLRLAYLVVAANAANPVTKQRRANSTAYALGTMVIPAGISLNGFYYEYTVAGTSGAAPPVYPTVPGNTVADGTATLTCRAGGFKPLVHAFSPPNAAWQPFSLDHSDLTIPHADLSAGCTVHVGLWRRGSADSHTGALELVKARAYPVGV